MPLQVFGVVRQGHPPLASEEDEDPYGVRLVESGGLAAAVTQLDEQAELTEEDAARHLDILILLLRDGPVLPLAFGTVSPDEDAVRSEVLDAAADDLTQRLQAVDGYVETRLDLFFDEVVALREVMQADPSLRDLAEETRGSEASLDTRIALGEAVSSHLTDWRRQQVDALLPALSEPVEDAVELEASEPLQQRWAFLVRAERLADLDAVVAEIRSSLGTAASLEYVGPLPVYSFLQQVQVEPTQQRSAWGW